MELHPHRQLRRRCELPACSPAFASWKLALLFLSVLIASENELRRNGNWNHRRQRSVSNGRAARRDRTQDGHPIWAAIGHARRRNAERAPGLFSAAARSRSPDFAARNKSSREYLRAPVAQ